MGAKMPKTYRDIFTAQHHALLFTGISKEVIDKIGKKNGHDLTVANYFAYGDREGEMGPGA